MQPLEFFQSLTGKEVTSSPSPFMLWLKPTVISAEKGKLSLQYTVRKEWTNPAGTLHGGVAAAICDDIMGATIFSLNEPDRYTTINLSIDYFSTAKEAEQIIADTIIIKKGKQFINVQCEIWNADKTRMLARGTSNLFKLNNNSNQ